MFLPYAYAYLFQTILYTQFFDRFRWMFCILKRKKKYKKYVLYEIIFHFQISSQESVEIYWCHFASSDKQLFVPVGND